MLFHFQTMLSLLLAKFFIYTCRSAFLASLIFFLSSSARILTTKLKNIYLGIPEENMQLSENAQFFPRFVFL